MNPDKYDEWVDRCLECGIDPSKTDPVETMLVWRGERKDTLAKLPLNDESNER